MISREVAALRVEPSASKQKSIGRRNGGLGRGFVFGTKASVIIRQRVGQVMLAFDSWRVIRSKLRSDAEFDVAV